MTDHSADVEVHLKVNLTAVEEVTRVLLVRCGQSTAEVKEHGRTGSGDWAAWAASGHIFGAGGTAGYPYGRAISDACAYVRREEKRRLLHEALREHLSSEDGAR